MADAYIAIELAESEINITNNTSKVTATLVYYGNGVSWSNYDCPWSLTLDGTRFSGSYSGITTSTSRQVIASRSKVVTHNTDGTKSVSASASLTVTGTSLGTLYGSASKTLSTIPRASSVKLSSGGTVGSQATFAITRYSTSFTHRAQWRVNGTSSWNNIGTGYTTSFTWTPPMSILNSFPNTASPKVDILLTTYNGSTSVGTYSTTITLSAGASVIPTFESAAAALVKREPYTGSAYIQGKSGASVTFTGAAGVYSSTIKTYRVTMPDGTVYNSTTSTVAVAVINSSGLVGMRCQVIDSRGRASAVQVVEVTAEAYEVPVITEFTPYRSGPDGTYLAGGEYVAALVKYTAATLTDNPIAWELQYRLEGTTTWTTYKNGQGTSVDATIVSDSAIVSVDYIYDLRLVVTDPFTEATAEAQIFSEQVLVDYHFSGTGLAFGKVADTPNAVESAFPSFQIREVEYAFSDEFIAAHPGESLEDMLESLGTRRLIYQSDKTVSGNPAGARTVNSITLPKGTGVWFVFANMRASVASSTEAVIHYLTCSGTSTMYGNHTTRGTMMAGGGSYTMGLIAVSNDYDCVVTQQGYGLASPTFNFVGSLYAVNVGEALAI